MFSAGAVALLLASTLVAQTAVPQLSKSEQAERIKLLAEEDRRWLAFVEPIILPGEQNFFLLLTEPHQREIFKEEFWKWRERQDLPTPLGPGYRQRYEELFKRANEAYDGWRQDAGLMVIAHGEPAELEVIKGCELTFRYLEIWTYGDAAPAARSPQRYFFYRTAPQSPRKLWRLGDPESEIFQPGSCRKSFEELWAECAARRGDPCFASCDSACRVYKIYFETRARQGSRSGGAKESAEALAPPAISTEDLPELAARFPAIADARARPSGVESARTISSVSTTPEAGQWLLAEEIRNRIVRLEPKYREWLELAAPLLTWGELVQFLQFSPSEKDQFIRAFFKKRS
jgi:GWxTD domain-containing protein